MSKFGIPLICICLSIAMVSVGKDILSIPHCVECLCKLESNSSDCIKESCVPDVKKTSQRSCGPLNLDVSYYRKCGSPGMDPTEDIDVAYQRCTTNATCTKACVKAYTSKYLYRCTLKASDCEKYVRIHFGGSVGCATKSTDAKWTWVKACLKSF